MSSDALTEEERSLIEAKRRKALESRNRNTAGGLVSSVPIVQKQNVVAKQPLCYEGGYDSMHTEKVGDFVHMARKWVESGKPTTVKPTGNLVKQQISQLKQNFIPKSSTNSFPSRTPQSTPNDAFRPKTSLANVLCTLCSANRFEVHARYHVGLTQLFKSMDSKQYDSQTRRWSFDLSEYNEFVKKVKNIDELHLEELPYAVIKIFRKRISMKPGADDLKDHDNNDEIDHSTLKDRIPDDLLATLFPFQKDGVCLALKRSGRVLLADDMGLGKTIQSLAIASAYYSEWPLLIITPSSVRFSWRDQIIRWLGKPLNLNLTHITVVNSGKDIMDDWDSFNSSPITIISYDLMSRYGKELLKRRYGVVIADESHFIKNIKAARTKAATPILKWAKRVILLSGTPAMSRPAELFPQISAISPNLFQGGFHEFGLRYCSAKECPWGWDYSGCSNMTELQLVLEKSIMIRRVKADVLSQLPPKRRELVVLDPSVIKKGNLGRHAKTMLTDKLSSKEKRSALFEYFHETGSVKLPAIEQYVLDLIECGHKFLLFAHHTDVLDSLDKLLSEKSIRFIRIDGRTNSEQRSVVCQIFQKEDDCRVALLSITAAGTGLHLTAANLVIFAELFWNPGALVQAEDRAYRIGQMDSVLIRYLIAEQTADDFIWPLVERKLDVLSKAGLNRETFRMADSTTRLGVCSLFSRSILLPFIVYCTGDIILFSNTLEQQKILDYFKKELNDFEEWENVDSVTSIINEQSNNTQSRNNKKNDNNNDHQNKFQTQNDSLMNQINPNQPKMTTSLFKSKSQSSVVNNTTPNKNNSKKRLLVPSSPESNHSEIFSNELNDNIDEDDLIWVDDVDDDDFVEQIDESDITDNNIEEFSGNDEYLLSEAVKIAEAVEVDWLTEGLIKEDTDDIEINL
uniref:Harp (Smarcal1)-related n=1 Tax=Schistosoma mansoni TaxID=6183 RepID=A0A3Q0KLV0_SCHMA